MGKTKNVEVIIFTIIVAVIVVGSGAYWWQKSVIKTRDAQDIQKIQGLQQQITNLQNQISKLIEEKNEHSNDPSKHFNETSNWETYENRKYGFKIRYPIT